MQTSKKLLLQNDQRPLKFKHNYQCKSLSRGARIGKSHPKELPIGSSYHGYFIERQKRVLKKVDVRHPDARIQSFEAGKIHMVSMMLAPVMQSHPPKQLHKDASNRLRKHLPLGISSKSKRMEGQAHHLLNAKISSNSISRVLLMNGPRSLAPITSLNNGTLQKVTYHMRNHPLSKLTRRPPTMTRRTFHHSRMMNHMVALRASIATDSRWRRHQCSRNSSQAKLSPKSYQHRL